MGRGRAMRWAVGKPDLAFETGSRRGALPPGKNRLAVREARVVRSGMATELRGADADPVTSPPPLRNYSGLDSRSSVSETAPRRSASLASRGAPVRVAGRDAELVVQVCQVLLDGGLGDDELVGDRSRGRRLGEHVAREQRTAEGDEHVALARRQGRRSLLDLGRGAGGAPAGRGTRAASGRSGSRRRVAIAARPRYARR